MKLKKEWPPRWDSSLEQRYGKACYVMTMDRIEEALWSSIDDDYYPTVEIFLGPPTGGMMKSSTMG